MNQRTAGTLMVVTSAAGFATLAIFVKFAYAAGVNIFTMLTARFMIAAAILWGVVRLWRVPVFIERKAVLKLFLMGTLGYGVMSFMFAGSLRYLPASLSAMLLYAYPALVSIISFFIGDEQFNKVKGFALLCCFAGLLLVLGVSFESANMLGILLGLGSALVYSVYIVVGNRVLKTIDSLVATTYVCSSAGITLLLVGLIGDLQSLSFAYSGWLALFGAAILGTVVGILGFFSGMTRIGAANASIISTLEPMITVILSALLLSERVTILQAIGGILIIAGILVLQIWAKDSSMHDKPNNSSPYTSQTE